MDELSTPAIALLTMLQDGNDSDSLYLREHFSREFPDSDYDACLVELKSSGMYPEPAELLQEERRKVRFHQLSSIPMRFD